MMTTKSSPAINTTPLVDVMLVLLIIFLITIPVVTHTVPVQLPKETNQPLQTKPENIIIAVNQRRRLLLEREAGGWADAAGTPENRVGHDAAAGSAHSR